MDNTMKETGFYKLLTETYKLDISDDEYQRLTEVLNFYDIEPGKLNITVEDSMMSFMYNLRLLRKVEANRAFFKMEFDDLLYILNPVPYPFTEKINVNVPCRLKHNTDTPNIDIPEMPQNMALIRTVVCLCREEGTFDQSYILYIFNSKLKTVAGIRFESIE